MNGVYVVHPDGGAWYAVQVVGERIVGRTDEASQATHDAACDRWAGLGRRIGQRQPLTGRHHEELCQLLDEPADMVVIEQVEP